MLIATDIGNSSIKIGYFTSQGLLVQRIATEPPEKTSSYLQQLHEFIRENNIEKGSCNSIISSVVPGITEQFSKALTEISGTVLVMGFQHAGIGLRIDRPEQLGTDRIANAVAAFAHVGQEVIVADLGTATTITVADRRGDYIGGAIMPGIGTMNESLGSRTSQLTSAAMMLPDQALGRNTEDCIRSGLFIGTAGAIERICAEIEQETGGSYALILTGGYGSLLAPIIRRKHTVRKDLTLEGLKIIHERQGAQ